MAAPSAAHTQDYHKVKGRIASFIAQHGRKEIKPDDLCRGLADVLYHDRGKYILDDAERAEMTTTVIDFVKAEMQTDRLPFGIGFRIAANALGDELCATSEKQDRLRRLTDFAIGIFAEKKDVSVYEKAKGACALAYCAQYHAHDKKIRADGKFDPQVVDLLQLWADESAADLKYNSDNREGMDALAEILVLAAQETTLDMQNMVVSRPLGNHRRICVVFKHATHYDDKPQVIRFTNGRISTFYSRSGLGATFDCARAEHNPIWSDFDMEAVEGFLAEYAALEA